MATTTTAALGWYRDPYRRHEDRYFSEGKPTKLVRDGRRESFDPPPDLPLPGPPVPVASHAPPSSGADLRRADDAERGPAYDRRTAGEKATSAMVRYGSAR